MRPAPQGTMLPSRMKLPCVQIAGALDLAEAEMLAAAGTEFIGLPLRLLDGREDLSEAEAARLVASLKKSHSATEVVAITYREQAEDIIDLAQTIDVEWIQLHGHISAAETQRLRLLAPELLLIKSLVISDENESHLAEEVADFGPLVKAFITDTHDPATGRRGATGLTHDWAISRRLVALSPKPVIIAGGLDETNVADAIRATHPAGVDAHTGLELPNGRKCAEKVALFLQRARAAFAELA